MIAAFKFHNVFALCIRARQTNRRHRRFGARTDEANLVHVRKGGNHQLGKIRFGRIRRSKAGPTARRCDHRRDNSRRSVSEDEWSPRADVVDILVFVGVPNVRAVAADDIERIASHAAKRAHRRVHASGNQLFSAFLQFAGLLGLAGHHSSKES